MARRFCALMRRYCARSAPWRPPDRRSPTASAMGRRIPDQRATLPVVRALPEARLQARARSRRRGLRAHGHRAGARAVRPPGYGATVSPAGATRRTSALPADLPRALLAAALRAAVGVRGAGGAGWEA